MNSFEPLPFSFVLLGSPVYMDGAERRTLGGVIHVVTNKDLIRKLSTVSPYAGCAKDAPVLIVSAYREDAISPAYAQIDLSIANENIWLEADALGLGGVWLGIAPVEERMKAVEEVLQLPAEHHAFAIFALGYPAENKPQQDRYDVSRIHYVK